MTNPEVPISAEQHEWWQKAWVALIEDTREFAELTEEILRVQGALDKTTFHQFTTSEKFLDSANLEDYDACFIDADFGYGNMRGFEAVPFIKDRRPDMLVIAVTDHEDYLKAFRETGADMVLKKAELIDSLPQILALAPPRE